MSPRGLGTVLALLLALGVVAEMTVLDRTDSSDADRATVRTPSEETDESVGAKAWQPTPEQWDEARQLVDRLTLEELAGQLIVARDDGAGAELVRDLHLAGVIVMAPTSGPEQLDALRRANRAVLRVGDERGIPTLVGVDQEGGQVARVADPMTVFPSFMTAGAALAGDEEDDVRDAQVVREAAAGSGAELRAAGFTTVFAPVADLTTADADPVIGSRSAGSDPDVVARAVVAAMQGYGDAGLVSTVKHFPGHDVGGDSHVTLPRLEGSRKELDRRDAAPFQSAVEAGAPAVMTGHLDVPAVDEGTPASASRAVVTDWLREDLGYDGLIVSDSLEMAPVADRYPGGASAVAVVEAGNDVALMPPDPVAARDALRTALESGDLPEEQARESATRTTAWLLAQREHEPLAGEPGSAESAARELSAAGLTVLTRPCERPLDLDSVTPVGDPQLVARFRSAAEAGGLGTSGGPTVALVGNSGPLPAADVTVATDRPHVLADAGSATRIALYGRGRPAMAALVDVLSGAEQARGQLPVDVPRVEPTSC